MQVILSISSPSEVFCKKGVLKNFAKSTGKQLYRQSCRLRPETSLNNKRPWHRCFPVDFAIFLRNPFSQEHLRWLLLTIVKIFFQICLNLPNLCWSLENKSVKCCKCS